MAGPTDNLPRRVLIVDDDELVRETVSTLLKAANFEGATAVDGAEALAMFGREWFPLVITDRAMPVIDGLQFVARVRALAINPVYVIMLTVSADVREHEEGYCAGVDLYLTKQGYEKELATRVVAGLGAIRRRRATRADGSESVVTVDLEAGAHTARHLVGRLHSEIATAVRTRQPLNLLSVRIEPDDAARQHIGAASSAALLQAVHSAVREKLDWVARLPAGGNGYRLAIVMPNSQAADVARVEQGIRNTLATSGDESALRGVKVTIGAAGLAQTDPPPTALELLGQSDRNRKEKDGAAPAAADAA
jgi:DNA-binding response OmpR family regulator